MIPFDFEYYRPATVREAYLLFHRLDLQGKQPVYYCGGTEIITAGRINLLRTGAVIDIKRIPECTVLAQAGGKLVLGAAITLSQLHDSGAFPLLGETAAGVADRTSRNKITLGGNICSRIMYREAVLPLLLTDSELHIAGADGVKQVPIHEVFQGELQLKKGEFLVQSATDASYLHKPYATVKKRKVSAIDYPLATVAAIRTDSAIRVAFSGVCDFPFRSAAIEDIVNRRSVPLEARIDEAVHALPASVLDDIKGSAAYRTLVLKNTLSDIVKRLGGE